MVASASLRGFNCGNCGAAVALRALTHTRAVACSSCGAILDPRDPNVHVLQTARGRETISPLIPLGSRGTWHGHPYEVVGFQQRSIEVEGTRYAWDEYVLFNPYRGFRYLSYYQGHWNDIATIRELPSQVGFGDRPAMQCRGNTFKHFQSATAQTDYVLGEFPWRVRVGDAVEVRDYIAPPFMLSSESTARETTWSLGAYLDPVAVWRAFSVPGEPPAPIGIFANQPNPHTGKAGKAAFAFAMLAGMLLLLVLFRVVTADREQVFAGNYVLVPGEPSAFVTDPFTISAPGTVEVALQAPTLTNAWVDFDLALIDLGQGTARNFTREVSFYSGTDSDGAWSEGDRGERVLLPQVPAGEYYLRVEPATDVKQSLAYTVHVRRDVPSLLPYGIGLALLMVPLVMTWMSNAGFERLRMAESDYAE